MTPCHVCVESKMRFPGDNLNIKKRQKNRLTCFQFKLLGNINVRKTTHFISIPEQVLILSVTHQISDFRQFSSCHPHARREHYHTKERISLH